MSNLSVFGTIIVSLLICTALIFIGYKEISLELARLNADIEVVVAAYDENLAWITNDNKQRQNQIRYTIYSKNENNVPNGAKLLPNVGRESQTFLHHIVTNYNSLADWTVFTQGSKPTFGFKANNQQSGHLCSGVTWDDYLHPRHDGWYEVQTVATRYPEMIHSDRFDMMFEIPTSQGNVCPTDFKENGWGKWWKEDTHPLLLKQTESDNFVPPVEFYNHLVVADASSKYYEQFTLNYANGGRFAVSRDRIQKRPLSYYENLLEELSKDINPIEGYYMETMWYDVFHPEHLQAEYGPVCNVPFFSDDASNHSTMYDESVKQYQDVLLEMYGSKSAIPRNLQQSNPYLLDSSTMEPTEPVDDEEEQEPVIPTPEKPEIKSFTVMLQLDDKPEETGLTINCDDNSRAEIPAGALARSNQEAVATVIEEQFMGVFDLEQQKIFLNASLTVGTTCQVYVMDAGGNGLCCDNGEGWYRFYQGLELIEVGGEFDYETTFEFTVSPTEN